MIDAQAEDLDFEPFQKFKSKNKYTGKTSNLRKSDYQIRSARRAKEKTKQAILEEVNSEE